MACATNEMTIDRAKILTENEWFDFLQCKTQLLNIDEMKMRQLAQRLSYYFMTIDDAIQLTEQQLITKCDIKQRNLLEQITAWQSSFFTNMTKTRGEQPVHNGKDPSTSSCKQSSLMGLYESMSGEISEDDVNDAIQQLQLVDNGEVEKFAQLYSDFVDALYSFGSEKFKDYNERIWYRCRSCRKAVWVAKCMGAFTSFPLCFREQLQSIDRIALSESSAIPDLPLD